MLKQMIAIVVLSILVIVGAPYAQSALEFIVTAHNWVADMLKEVFSGGEIGNLIRQLIALLAIPLAASLIPVIVLWLAKRTWFTYFMEVVWIIWLVQTSAVIIATKAAG